MIIRHVDDGLVCCDPIWEKAYQRFETREQEINKFIARLRRLGADELDRDVRILELFCGRGGGLTALRRLQFRHVEGLDLSESLLGQCDDTATLHLADCRRLPFDDGRFDIAIVQGGLHHLEDLNEDLDACLSEANRILQSNGLFWMVEPWMTPFLKWAHRITDHPFVRRIYPRGDALATMTEREASTYYHWLEEPDHILNSLSRYFDVQSRSIAWGKIEFSGRPRRETDA
ncbi:MAG: class I SAM-dependent methyltransferase [Planctomycetota bacterium]